MIAIYTITQICLKFGFRFITYAEDAKVQSGFFKGFVLSKVTLGLHFNFLFIEYNDIVELHYNFIINLEILSLSMNSLDGIDHIATKNKTLYIMQFQSIFLRIHS